MTTNTCDIIRRVVSRDKAFGYPAGSASQAATTAPLRRPSGWPANDASGVLFGLTLALSAPTDAQAEAVAQLAFDIYSRSPLTADDLDTLKDAAVVIWNAEGA